MLPFRHRTRIRNAKCRAVGIVKGFLPEEVLSVDCFFLYRVKEKKDLNQCLLCWITFGEHNICWSEILIYWLLANTSHIFYSNWTMLLRGLLLLVCVLAEMLGIKEMVKKNNTSHVSQRTPVPWWNFLSYLKKLKLGHENWALSSGLQRAGKIWHSLLPGSTSFKCKV